MSEQQLAGGGHRHINAADLWSARTAVSITVDQAHRQQTDADRAEVERLTAEVAKLTADRDEWCRLWTELGRGNRALAAEVADLTAERDRAHADLQTERDLLGDCLSIAISRRDALLAEVADLQTERNLLTAERDQAIYERDTYAVAALNGR